MFNSIQRITEVYRDILANPLVFSKKCAPIIVSHNKDLQIFHR